MKAMVIREFGGPEVLRLEDVDIPRPGPGQARVAVRAIAVLRTRDVAARTGNHPFSRQIELPHVFGGEHSGVVDAVGEGVDPGLVGRRVAVGSVVNCGECATCLRGRDEACQHIRMIGIQLQGSYADHALAPAVNLHEIPDDLPFEEAAVLAAVGPVALAQLDAAEVGPGTNLAVPGGAGSLGSMIVALGIHREARTIVIERPGVEAERVAGGQVKVLTDQGEALTKGLLASTDGEGLDAVVDNLALVGPWEAYGAALAPLARVVVSGAIGNEPLPLDPRRLYLRNQSVIGVRTGNRAHIEALWEEVAAGFRIGPDLLETFPLEAAAEAHRGLEGDSKVGHHVLVVAG